MHNCVKEEFASVVAGVELLPLASLGGLRARAEWVV